MPGHSRAQRAGCKSFRDDGMTAKNEFVEHLLELLASFGEVHARRMFGGHGIYREELMFGLVANNTLYLKTDQMNRPEFEALGLDCFEYQKKDKKVKIAYYEAPPECLENAGEMLRWAESAYGAALRAAKRKA
ncbi:MAG: TfoX/Sxy family protein [Calditrichaeota bacterium]|nr:TfoX/Sxy family protein [Calditrichota bacterium]